jgi:hypothetical protein
MNKSAPLWLACVGSAVVAFIFGGAFGTLTMKWSAEAELRSLRAQAQELAKSGKVCCDAAYVAIKYRPDCSAASAGSVKP